MESVLKDNALTLEPARKYNVNFILVDEQYEVDVEL